MAAEKRPDRKPASRPRAQGGVLLPQEDPQEYITLRAELVHQYQPGSAHERMLVDLVVQCRWRLLRCERLEAALNDPSLATSEPKEDTATFRHFQTAVQRSHDRALRALCRAQADRKIAEATKIPASSIDLPVQYGHPGPIAPVIPLRRLRLM